MYYSAEKLVAMLEETRCETDRVGRAFFFASKKHHGQKRKDGLEPYFCHPVRVALKVFAHGLNWHGVCLALLHDTVEDTDTTHEEITINFGREIGAGVFALTKPGLAYLDRRSTTIREQYLKQLKEAGPQVQTVKCADIVDNCYDIRRVEPKYAPVYFARCLEILEQLNLAEEKLRSDALALVRYEMSCK